MKNFLLVGSILSLSISIVMGSTNTYESKKHQKKQYKKKQHNNMNATDYQKWWKKNGGDAVFTIQDNNSDKVKTKIINDSFDLNLISSLPFTGTVCSIIIDKNNNDKELNSWTKNYFNNQTKVTNTYKSKYITKDAQLKVVWLVGKDVECPISNETDYKTSDDFAIRPYKYQIISSNDNIYAGDSFKLLFNVLDKDGNIVNNYNEDLNNSFEIVYDRKSGCNIGNLDIDIKFKDGTNTTIANYNDIGDLNITIKEKVGEEYSKIDDSEDSDNEKYILENNISIKDIKPYKILLSTIFSDNNITFMDKNLNNFSSLTTNVKILSADNKIITDFNNSCYAKDINISYTTKQNTIPESFTWIYTSTPKTLFKNWEDNITLDSTYFKNGEMNYTISFNIKKDYSKPISVKELNFTKVSIMTGNLAKIESNETVDKNISFYYARVLPKDIYTKNPDVNSTFSIIIYDQNKNHFVTYDKDGNLISTQRLLNWYLDIKDTTNKDDVKLLGYMKNYIFNSDKNVSGFEANLTKSYSDVYEYNLTTKNSNNNKFVVIHLKTPYYLWYSPYNDYNDSNKSGCIEHYCVEYHYNIPVEVQQNIEVGSGDFKGSTTQIKHNSKVERKGIKIYR